jgi:hypothetical protein
MKMRSGGATREKWSIFGWEGQGEDQKIFKAPKVVALA